MELHAKLSYSEIRTTSNLQRKAMSSYRYSLLLIYMHQFPKSYNKLFFWEGRERVSRGKGNEKVGQCLTGEENRLVHLERQRLRKARVYWGGVEVGSSGARGARWEHAVRDEQCLKQRRLLRLTWGLS